MSELRHKIILDCDPGIDDAMALYGALAHPAVELLAVTTTFGNVAAPQAARNALYLCHLAGRAIPVAEGVNTPARKAPVQPDTELHGRDGLGNLPERRHDGYGPDERSAARLIVDLAHAHAGELTLLTTGPLGNLSQALRLEPRLPQLIKQLIVVGGSITAPGTVSPVAETNVWLDPHAADQILTAGFCLTLLPLDVSQQLALPLALLERVAAQHQHPAIDTLLHAARFSAAAWAPLEPTLAAHNACPGADLLGLVYLLRPELFTVQAGRVRVATDGLAEGQTLMDRREHMPYPQPGWEEQVPRISVCLQADVPSCIAFVEETLIRPWLSRPT